MHYLFTTPHATQDMPNVFQIPREGHGDVALVMQDGDPSASVAVGRLCYGLLGDGIVYGGSLERVRSNGPTWESCDLLSQILDRRTGGNELT